MGPMRLCARKSHHPFSQRDFRIQRMLSQDEMLHKALANDPNVDFDGGVLEISVDGESVRQGVTAGCAT